MVATCPIETFDLDSQQLPLASEDAVELRRIAKRSPYPRNRLYSLLADLVECDRRLGRVGPPQPTDVARRYDLLGQLDDERNKAAESFLAMFALAIDRRPNEVAAMLSPFLAKLFGTTWDHLTQRIDALETALAAQLETAR